MEYGLLTMLPLFEELESLSEEPTWRAYRVFPLVWAMQEQQLLTVLIPRDAAVVCCFYHHPRLPPLLDSIKCCVQVFCSIDPNEMRQRYDLANGEEVTEQTMQTKRKCFIFIFIFNSIKYIIYITGCQIMWVLDLTCSTVSL